MEETRCFGCMKEKTQHPVCEHCGYDESIGNEPHQLPCGTVLRDQYMVGKVLGQGGFGITYLGWDLTLEIPVAIKEYYPHSMVTRDTKQSLNVAEISGSMTEPLRSSRERFLREAKALARFGSVPEIVRVYSFFEENGTAYIVMEYVEGIDLRRYCKLRGGCLSVQETFGLLRPVMEALSIVHQAGLVHRDISPDNIMILPNGSTKLLDFGAVRNVDGAETDKVLTHSTQTILKHGFAPVEQYQSRGSLGPWTDVYALCGTIYYCLTGEIPMDAPLRITEESNVPWTQVGGLTAQQITALDKGMELLPRKRTSTVQELYEQLYSGPLPETKAEELPTPADLPSRQSEPLTGSETVSGEPEQEPKPGRKPYKLLLGIGAAVLALVCAIAFFAAAGKPDAAQMQPAVQRTESDGTEPGAESGDPESPAAARETQVETAESGVDRIVELDFNMTYCLNDPLNAETMDLTAVYASGKREAVTEEFTCSPQLLDTAGTQEVTVTYAGVTTTRSVEVMDFFTQEVNIQNLHGVDYNEYGNVSWVLYVTARYYGNYVDSKVFHNVDWDREFSNNFAVEWEEAKAGNCSSWNYYCGDQGYGEYWAGIAFILPDDYQFAGDYSVTIKFGEVKKTATFTLLYEGDYEAEGDTGWTVTNIRWA